MPMRSSLPNEVPGLRGRMDKIDQELAAEIMLKISLDDLIDQLGIIPIANLVKHLQEFPHSSKAITRESLRRIQAGILLFETEHSSPINEFTKSTKNQPRYDYVS